MKHANSPVYRVQGGHLELALGEKKKNTTHTHTISKDAPKANQARIQQPLKHVSPEATSSLKPQPPGPSECPPSTLLRLSKMIHSRQGQRGVHYPRRVERESCQSQSLISVFVVSGPEGCKQ